MPEGPSRKKKKTSKQKHKPQTKRCNELKSEETDHRSDRRSRKRKFNRSNH